ncbi:twin-arginine translocase subunit TatC [Dermatophilus congolensis]|uniref:twin-arginine translocase subunit TatC n=1 Tax=Dermatophilus congolensis TaxID=1863 RepID=UPI00312C9D1C
MSASGGHEVTDVDGPGVAGSSVHRQVRRPRLKHRRRDPEGRMPLAEHLRELKNRFLVALLALVVAAVPGWMWYEPILNDLTSPLRMRRGDVNYATLTSPLAVQIQVALFVALILSSPMWIYQVWAFIVPGLRRKEKWTALAFMLTAIPLFVSGCWLAYVTLPKAIVILIGFTPSQGVNIVPADEYLTFVTRFIVAFGCAFLLPVFLVGLNMIGVFPAAAMLRGWRFAVVGLFVFAAFITPTPDPWTMFGLAIPMTVLYFAAWAVASLLERSKARKRPEWSNLSYDQASPL